MRLHANSAIAQKIDSQMDLDLQEKKTNFLKKIHRNVLSVDWKIINLVKGGDL